MIGLQSLQRLAHGRAAHPESAASAPSLIGLPGRMSSMISFIDALRAFFVLTIFWVMMGSCLR